MTTSLHNDTADLAARGTLTGDRARAVFGQAMGLVAVTVGFCALGAYVGRDLTGGFAIAFLVAGFGTLIALNVVSRAGTERITTTLLFTVGLLLGLALGPGLRQYATADPAVLWQAAGLTAGFVAILGLAGYASRSDLSSWARTLFWATLALITFLVVATFVSIPHAHVIYAVAGIAIFGGYTMFDFNRLRRAGVDDAVPIAASIFLDVLNVFLFFVQLLAPEG